MQAITNFDTEFPRNQPPGALEALLQLLGLLVRFDPNPSKLGLQLADWTEVRTPPLKKQKAQSEVSSCRLDRDTYSLLKSTRSFKKETSLAN